MNTKKFIAKIALLSLVAGMFAYINPAQAASFGSPKDTMSRLKASTTANHSVAFTLPATIDLDSTGNVDTLRVDFPAGFTLGGTWVAGDFTFNDGTARTISAVSQGAATIDCTPTGGANDVCVAVDTTNNVFTIEVGSAYTASAAAAAVTFTIAGVTADGTLTNPASTGSHTVAIAMCDETASCSSSFTTSHSSTLAVGIADDDQVSVTASVDASLTFDLDTATTDTESATPYQVPLGTVSTTNSKASGTTDSVNYIWMNLDTNASNGAVITVQNANGASGMVSTSVPTDAIVSTAGSNTIANGTENYGICVTGTAATTGSFVEVSPFDNADCSADDQTPTVGGLTGAIQNLVHTNSNPVAAGRVQVTVAAAVSGITEAHTDYTDTLTFIATGTF